MKLTPHRGTLRTSACALVAVACGASALVPQPAAGQVALTAPPTGFAPHRVEAQLACEAQLMHLPRPAQFRRHLETITRVPHPAGSAAQRDVEDYLAQVMANAGLDVERYPYDVYLPQLTDDVTAAIVTPEPMTLSNQEPALPEDRFSGHPDLLNGWNAYSGSGDVTAQVVYANFGRKEDFDHLTEMGVSIAGKVVIARYGGNFRGYKVKFAQEHGAAGVIMFNDPGEVVGIDEYPRGPNMSPGTIQRGSVLTLNYKGDPLTPFEPAYPVDSGIDVNRLDPSDVDLHEIPVLPLGYGAASEILRRMTGGVAPEEWRGGIDVPYRYTGGSQLTVRVRVDQPKALTRAVNVVGTVVGAELPNEWVIFGSHYDPWGFGAIDPNGGTAMLLTMAEALGELAANGCRPRRSILVAHWDAEEYGIIGSAEWVEQFRGELDASAVAYINADSAVSGPRFGSSASPSLKGLIIEATKAVDYPKTSTTVYGEWLRASEEGGPRMGNLGGGSDHVGFYTHIGVPSGSLGFSGGGGVYHSNYDNFAWYERFGDHEFVYGPTLARVDGVLALRLANADVLPYDVERYAADLETHARTLRELAAEHDIEVRFDDLAAAAGRLAEASHRYVAARDVAVVERRFPDAELRAINRLLLSLERALLHEEGLQERPWYRSLYASPDPFSGYASWMLPGLRYEIETQNPGQLAFWETVYVDAVGELSRRVDELTEALGVRD
ncbi:MAG TPA: M28 family peptidase [Acidobacteriota bacterium]|nr:M28 family peptidase [Acidobacteriota bacterium]